ncbi:hypothetical protein AB0G60_06085 [Streptomyces angustmyceticus]|nr:hypothetical protein [Streptomyces angustmyceticus]UAL69049.1 hypothetical protein K7396_23015 [Streptomyces angustmyceticus]
MGTNRSFRSTVLPFPTSSKIAHAPAGLLVPLPGRFLAMLDERQVPDGELRFLAERLVEALRDVLRIAESRGAGCGAAEDPG